VNVLTISAINLSEEFDTNQVISVTVSGGSGSYEYQLDNGLWQFSSVFEYVTGCDEHTVVVRDAIDTCNTEPETTVSIMEYPKFFTPNGDGFNDTWNIKCLKDNPLARIRIYDRYGKLLLDFRPSQNAWNGTFNGQRLPGSDYWFDANYLNSNGVEAQFRSHFSLRY
jgi:gliding motility-associated-like protein